MALGKDSTVVAEFDHVDLHCVVLRIEFTTDTFHNGYVKVAESADEVDQEFSNWKSELDTTYNRFLSEIETDELTFSGELLHDVESGYYLGFDSAHAWNDQRPETKTKESVKARTKELAEELVEKNVPERIKDGGLRWS